MTFGNIELEQVNSRKTQVFIKDGAGEAEYQAVQDKSLVLNYDVSVEPLTSRKTAFFAGPFLGGLFTGTMIYTDDISGVSGNEGTFLNLSAKDANTGGNVEKEWRMKLITKGSVTKVYTFNGILQTFTLSGAVPGGAKYDLAIFVTSEPTIA